MAQGIWTPGGGFDRQPQGPVEVDWSNPIARGLQLWWNGSTPSNSFKPGQTSNVTVSGTREARGGRYTATGQTFSSASSQSIDLGPFPAFSAITTLLVAESSAVNSIAVSSRTGGVAAGFDAVLFGNGGVAGANSPLRVGNSASSSAAGYTSGANDGRLHAYMGRWVGGTPSSIQGWIDGVSTGSPAFLVDFSGPITSSQNVKLALRGTTYWSGFIGAFLAWDRALSDAEIASISANPWQLFRDDTSDILIFDMGAGGGITLTPPLLANSNTLYAPALTPGAVSVAPPLLTNSSTLHAPTLTVGGTVLQPPLLTNTNDLIAPTLTPGAISVAPPLLPSSNAFFAPVVSVGGTVLQAPLLENTSTPYAPSVGVGAIALGPPLLTNGGTLYAPTVAATGPQTLEPPLLTNASTLFAPTVGGVLPLSDAEMRHMYEMVQSIYAAVVTNAPLDVNLVRVRGQTIGGTGSAVDPWGPV